jgi:glutaredoxin/predicted small secreted protein
MRLRVVLALLVACSLVLAGCPKKSGIGADDGGATAGDEAPITVKPDSEGLLLTWIDDKGDFHVEQKVADVPMTGRDAVRVVDPNKDDGTSNDRIFVADLRTARPDGTYPVHISTRADFEKLAVARREQKGPTLASAAPPASTQAPPPAQPGQAPNNNALPDPQANARPVIVYGAEWCGPCHQAQSYLRSHNIAFVYKDVDNDRAANKEMQEKLARAGKHGGSIPVIDVRGKILVGFSAAQIDEALGKAL